MIWIAAKDFDPVDTVGAQIFLLDCPGNPCTQLATATQPHFTPGSDFTKLTMTLPSVEHSFGVGRRLAVRIVYPKPKGDAARIWLAYAGYLLPGQPESHDPWIDCHYDDHLAPNDDYSRRINHYLHNDIAVGDDYILAHHAAVGNDDNILNASGRNNHDPCEQRDHHDPGERRTGAGHHDDSSAIARCTPGQFSNGKSEFGGRSLLSRRGSRPFHHRASALAPGRTGSLLPVSSRSHQESVSRLDGSGSPRRAVGTGRNETQA